MIRNYFNTAIRRLLRNKSISVINILGLALGMATVIVILLFVFHELSFDKYHTKKDRIYRVVQENKAHNMHMARAPYPLAEVLRKDYPQVEKTARMIKLHKTLVKKGDNRIHEPNFFCAENSLFEILTVPVVKGDPENLTTDPDDVVLTESMAQKYFGNDEAVGKEFIITNMGEEIALNVSGVIADFPENSTLKPDFIASMDLGVSLLPKMIQSTSDKEVTSDYYKTTWDFASTMIYILADENFQLPQFESALREIEEKYLENPDDKKFHLQNIQDIYFYSGHILSQSTVTGNVKNVYIFASVGLLILLIACINYILLSTSQAIERSREIGVRKIAGASGKALFNQVLMESFIVTLIAFPLALIIIEQARPLIVRMMNVNFLNYSLDLKIFLGFAIVLFLVTYFPGLVTVRFFSKINPVTAFSGENNVGSKRGVGRKLLISLQFIIFLGLVSISLGIFKQIQYSKTHELGFNPENILTIEIADNPSAKQSYNSFKNELLQHKDILNVSAGMWVPPTRNKMSVALTPEDGRNEKINLEALFVDKDFIETMSISLLSGKSLSDFGNNFERKVLINERAVEELGFDNPIGESAGMGEIVGVVEDFHYHSFREEISPMIIVGGQKMIQQVLVKTTGRNLKPVKQYIIEKWEKFAGSTSLEILFLDQHFQKLYHKDKQMALLISIFAGIAILVALMGLVGLTIFTLKKRKKEIAIRKVNGAKLSNILSLISLDYVKLIFVSFIIAAPLSYYFLQKWLQDFAYKTNLPWWIFVASGVFGLIITLITIGYQSYQAASRNPVDSLRDE